MPNDEIGSVLGHRLAQIFDRFDEQLRPELRRLLEAEVVRPLEVLRIERVKRQDVVAISVWDMLNIINLQI